MMLIFTICNSKAHLSGTPAYLFCVPTMALLRYRKGNKAYWSNERGGKLTVIVETTKTGVYLIYLPLVVDLN